MLHGTLQGIKKLLAGMTIAALVAAPCYAAPFSWGSSGGKVKPNKLNATDTPNDNEVATYDAATGNFTWEPDATGAPDTADYLVGTANGSLSAEIVVGTSPGGELGGTWASPTIDTIHSGSAHHAAVTVSGTPDYITLTGQDIVRSTVDIGDDTNLAGTANEIILTGDTLSLSLLKDLVTSAPITGGTDNILIGADSDVTLGWNWDAVSAGDYPDNSVTSADLEDDLAFGTFPTTPAAAPDADYEVANKKYVDDNAGGSAPSGSNNQVLTDDGAGGIVSEANLTFDGDFLIVSHATDEAVARPLQLYGPNRGTAADNDRYVIDYYMEDDAGGKDRVAYIQLLVNDVSNTTEDAYWSFDAKSNGAVENVMQLGSQSASTGVAGATFNSESADQDFRVYTDNTKTFWADGSADCFWFGDTSADKGGFVNIEGQNDEEQLVIAGNSTQNANILTIETSAAAVVFSVKNSLNTGGNAGTDLCIDANGTVCACSTCA